MCNCPGGLVGAQVCAFDGAAWEACECVAPDDDDVTSDDDDVTSDDDDVTPPDDDDVTPPDDDDVTPPDDDDVTPPDDDDDVTSPDDDDVTSPDDDDVTSSECIDDGLEDNDDAPSATPAPAPFFFSLQVCEADDDWFTTDLDAGDLLWLHAVFSNAEGNIDVEILDAAAGLLSQGTTTSDNETLTFTAPVAQTVFIHVFLVADAGVIGGNAYILESTSTPTGGGCADDAFEENDDPTMSAAIPFGTTTGLEFCAVVDEDWYVVPASVGDVLSVDAAFSHAEGNIDLELLDMTTLVLAASTSTTDNESLTWTVTTSGDHFIHAMMLSDTGSVDGNSYSLTVASSGAGCVDDAFEENDDPVTSAALSVGLTPGLQVCGTDEDWFQITLSAGDTLDIDVLFSHAEGNIDVDLYDPTASVVQTSASTTDNEAVSWVATADGPHLIGVVLTADSGSLPGNSYSLDVATSAVTGCVDDAFEENDSEAAALALGDGSYGGMVSCPSDSDFYLLSLVVGEDVDVDLAFLHSDGNIDVEVLDSAGFVVVSSLSLDDDEALTVSPLLDDDYYVHVYLEEDFGDPGVDYEMTLTFGLAPTPCLDDAFEDNDTIGAAVGVPFAGFADLTICPSDDDYYSFEMATGDGLDVSAEFEVLDADVDLFLYDPSGVQVASAATTGAPENLAYTAASAGTYSLGATLADDPGPTGAIYELYLTATPTAPPCSPGDFFEPNDTAGTAYVITTETDVTGVGACPSDDDWFATDFGVGELVVISLTFPVAEGNIDVEIFNPDGSLLVTGTTTGDNEVVAQLTVQSGVHTIRVYLESDAGAAVGNTYGMN